MIPLHYMYHPGWLSCPRNSLPSWSKSLKKNSDQRNKDYHFGNIITNIWYFCLSELKKMKYQDAKLNLTVMISRVWGFYAAVYKIKNFSKLWINLVDEAFSASFVRFLSKFIVQDDYCLFYSSISYAQFTGTRMWCTELHFVTHVSHALVILFTILQMNSANELGELA